MQVIEAKITLAYDEGGILPGKVHELLDNALEHMRQENMLSEPEDEEVSCIRVGVLSTAVQVPYTDLMRRYLEHREAQRATGHRLLAFTTPCCGFDMHTPQPPNGEMWSALTQCPACGEQFQRSANYSGVAVGVPVPAPTESSEDGPARAQRRKARAKK